MHTNSFRAPIRSAVPASSTWSAINRIIYVPFFLSQGSTVYRYFWLNGATVGTNNFQVGVYTAAFAAVNRGTSTLSAGTANLCQFDNITDYYLSPGRYYMAMWGSGTTATVFRISNQSAQPQGVYYETNAGGLPTTGTPVDPAGGQAAYLPVFGLAFRATDP
jgi:hypothetical protein